MNRWWVLVGLVAVAGCNRDKDEEQETKAPPLPSLTFDAPGAAAWLPEGAVTASGTASAVTEVTLNGAPATLASGAWQQEVTLVRGVNLLEAVATGENGDHPFVRKGVLAGTFAEASGPSKEAAEVRVNQGGLDRALEIVGELIDVVAINDALTGFNPVYSDTYEVWGFEAVTISADVTSIAFDPPVLVADPEPGFLALEIDLPNIDVQGRAYGTALGFDFDETFAVGASHGVVSARVYLGAEDGQLTVDLTEAGVELTDFWYDTSLIPGEIEDYLLVDTIRDYLESTLVEQMTLLVPPLLNDTLSALAPSTEIELLGLPVGVAWSFSEAGVDPDGAYLLLDLDIDIPEQLDDPTEGYLSAPIGAPDVDTEADVAGAISDDILNRALYEAWRGGMLEQTLSTDDGSLEGFMLAPLHATQGSIALHAALPPVIVETNGALEAQISELHVQLDLADSDLGSTLTGTLTVRVPVELEVEDGELRPRLGEPVLALMVLDSDWGASAETTTRLLEENLPVEALMLLLGGLSFPLPSLYGLAVESGEATREGDGAYTNITLSLQ